MPLTIGCTSEAVGEGDLFFVCQVLIAEDKHGVISKRCADLVELLICQIVELDAVNFSAKGPCHSFQLKAVACHVFSFCPAQLCADPYRLWII